MSDVEHRSYWIACLNVPDAVSGAKDRARDEGWRVLTVARVSLAHMGPQTGWRVELAVRPKEEP